MLVNEYNQACSSQGTAAINMLSKLYDVSSGQSTKLFGSGDTVCLFAAEALSELDVHQYVVQRNTEGRQYLLTSGAGKHMLAFDDFGNSQLLASHHVTSNHMNAVQQTPSDIMLAFCTVDLELHVSPVEFITVGLL